jgi:NTP pyrophosphatase (non-canonical NTP hydrolase)
MDKRLDEIIERVRTEVDYATTLYPAFNSAHEGISVLKEEVDELWTEVKVKQGKRNVDNMRQEAIQVAAMAIRFAYDICRTEESGQK